MDWDGNVNRNEVKRQTLLVDLTHAISLFCFISLSVSGFLSSTSITICKPWLLLCALPSTLHSVDLALKEPRARALYTQLVTEISDQQLCQLQTLPGPAKSVSGLRSSMAVVSNLTANGGGGQLAAPPKTLSSIRKCENCFWGKKTNNNKTPPTKSQANDCTPYSKAGIFQYSCWVFLDWKVAFCGFPVTAFWWQAQNKLLK